MRNVHNRLHGRSKEANPLLYALSDSHSSMYLMSLRSEPVPRDAPTMKAVMDIAHDRVSHFSTFRLVSLQLLKSLR